MRIELRLAGFVMLSTVCGCIHEQSEPRSSAPMSKPPNRADQNLVQYATAMCGTSTAGPAIWGDNNCFPGAVAPLGMVQWSPDTEAGNNPSGYSYSDSRISDFSLDHMSGGGCPYGQDFGFMPLPGAAPTSPPASRTAFATPFSHTNEVAQPGYYAVRLDDGIKVELTATTRSGFGRFTYPKSGSATLMVDAISAVEVNVKSINDVFKSGVISSSFHVNPTEREISGSAVGGRFCQYPGVRTVYFVTVFNRPFAAWSVWSGKKLTPGGTNGNGSNVGVFITFDTGKGKTVLAKVGISYVSIANAKANLEAESSLSAFSSADFDEAVQSARENWNSWFGRIQVSGGTTDEMKTFYSMLYHSLLAPSVCSDVNGDYMGYDGQVHNTGGRRQYCLFSGWDIYRSECQLLAMIAPKEASDMAQSLLADYQQGSAFPRWGAIDSDTGIMIGDPAAPMIVDFYAFGATNFDAPAALAGLVRAATDPSVRAERSGINERDSLEDYLNLGYVPEHHTGGYGSVSMTLEYASDDAALAQFAKALGDKADYSMLMQHAQNWRNLYNPETGYFQMRRRDGTWAPGFTNNSSSYDNETAYVEGTAGQYVWMVPFNLKGLIDTMGGPAPTAKRLDAFFRKLNVDFWGPDGWMAWMGNEPCLGTPWIYCFLGQPYKTQEVVRRTMTQLYSYKPVGYAGNDDLGEMSSWYVLSALGIYPEIPGSDVLVLGSPLFSKAVLRLQNGDATIIGNGAAKDAPYVQSLTVNGQTWDKPWIRFADISHGGTLVYDLGSTANTNWGSSPADAPPSYSDGVAQINASQ